MKTQLSESETLQVLLNNPFGKSIFDSVRETGNLDWHAVNNAFDTLSKEELDKLRFPENVYIPDERLITRINDYKRWRNKEKAENSGELMEEIALLVFLSLQQSPNEFNIESYPSYAHQYDLVVDGPREPTTNWHRLIKYLGLSDVSSIVVVEAKNTKEQVSLSQFSRMCAILQNHFANSCQLGVFFTREGVSGFPGKDGKQQRSLKFSKAAQIIFFAKTNKYIVAIDEHEFDRLMQPGGFIRLLDEKIREVEKVTGVDRFDQDVSLKKSLLPDHLAKWMPQKRNEKE